MVRTEKQPHPSSTPSEQGRFVLWETKTGRVELSDKACFNYFFLPLFLIFLALMLRRPVQAFFSGEDIQVRPGRGVTYRGRKLNLNTRWIYIMRRMKRIPYDQLTTFWAEGRYFHCMKHARSGVVLVFCSSAPTLRPADRIACIWAEATHARWRKRYLDQIRIDEVLMKWQGWHREPGENQVWFPEQGALFEYGPAGEISGVLLVKPDRDYAAKE